MDQFSGRAGAGGSESAPHHEYPRHDYLQVDLVGESRCAAPRCAVLCCAPRRVGLVHVLHIRICWRDAQCYYWLWLRYGIRGIASVLMAGNHAVAGALDA